MNRALDDLRATIRALPLWMEAHGPVRIYCGSAQAPGYILHERQPFVRRPSDEQIEALALRAKARRERRTGDTA